MSCNLITIQVGHKVAAPVRDEAEYRRLRNTKEQQENVRLAREGNEQAKKRLAQFNYSGHYPDGIVKGTRLPSTVFGFDMDDQTEFERVSKILLSAPEKYGLLMLERSARQGGHAILRRTQGRTILECQVELAMQLRCEMDTSAHDINRIYYATTASSDDLLYLSQDLFTDDYDEETVKAESVLLEARERNGQEILPPGAHKANKHYRPYELLQNVEAYAVTTQQPTLADEKDKQKTGEPNYEGIPYKHIIKQWWALYNDSKEPTEGNRDTLTFELARDLRHICGFNRDLLNLVIPAYDAFPEAAKMKCIDSALAQPRTQMPYRIKTVLKTLQSNKQGKEEDALYWWKLMPKMPMGVSDSIEGAGYELAMPVLAATCPIIGALATNVKVTVHEVEKNLNLYSFICGLFSSNKGRIEKLVEEWVAEYLEQDEEYWDKEEKYKLKSRRDKNKKELPVEERYPVFNLTLENTMANIAQRLSNAKGRHCFSFTPEADTVIAKWKNDVAEFSVMMRKAYDGSRHDREAKSVDAVSVHIRHLLWNVVMCGTPDALYRLMNNTTDGYLSRAIISSTPDNTFKPLEKHPPRLTAKNKQQIHQIAHLLPLMQGTIDLPKLEERGQIWLEAVRLEAKGVDDKAKARIRMRACVNAQVMTACILVVKAAEKLIKKHGVEEAEDVLKAEPDCWLKMLPSLIKGDFLEIFDILADYMLEQTLLYFRTHLESALKETNISSSGERSRHGKNDIILTGMPQIFTFEELWAKTVEIKGTNVTENTLKQMIKNWKRAGLIEVVEENTFSKTYTNTCQ